MLNIPSNILIVGSTVGALFMGILVMFVRIKGQNKPVNSKKILIPPIAMSTGSLMFIFEQFRITFIQVIEASIVGLLFSIVLIATSKFEVRNNEIYMKRSKMFFFILMGLLVFRIIWKTLLTNSLHVGQLGGMFWILAFSMIWPWRIAMLVQFRKIQKTQIVQQNSN